MMDCRSSQMLDDEEYDEVTYIKEGGFGVRLKSEQMSLFSGFTSNVASVRTNQHKSDLRRLERDRKENTDVNVAFLKTLFFKKKCLKSL